MTPQSMRAVLLTAHGGFDCLQVRADVPVPRLDSGDVLVKISAAGVNNTDINTRIGWYAPDSIAQTPLARKAYSDGCASPAIAPPACDGVLPNPRPLAWFTANW